MPSWSATWADVQFDHAAALSAAARLEALAGLLQQSCVALAAQHRRSTEHWLGPHRASSDQHLAEWGRRTAAIGGELLADARGIRQASVAAESEQARRLVERAAWTAEAAAETAAAAAATAAATDPVTLGPGAP